MFFVNVFDFLILFFEKHAYPDKMSFLLSFSIFLFVQVYFGRMGEKTIARGGD